MSFPNIVPIDEQPLKDKLSQLFSRKFSYAAPISSGLIPRVLEVTYHRGPEQIAMTRQDFYTSYISFDNYALRLTREVVLCHDDDNWNEYSLIASLTHKRTKYVREIRLDVANTGACDFSSRHDARTMLPYLLTVTALYELHPRVYGNATYMKNPQLELDATLEECVKNVSTLVQTVGSRLPLPLGTFVLGRRDAAPIEMSYTMFMFVKDK